MIKRLLFTLLIFAVQVAWAGNASSYKVSELREEYVEASRSEEAGKAFYKKMSAYKGKDPVVLAYKGASEAVMAKYVWNPYSKMKHLKAGAGFFEEAVALDAAHPEIRFLRFTVEHYVPRYLNMSQNVEEDKKVIISSLQSHPKSGLSAELARTMRDFLLQKDHCTEEEKKTLRSIRI